MGGRVKRERERERDERESGRKGAARSHFFSSPQVRLVRVLLKMASVRALLPSTPRAVHPFAPARRSRPRSVAAAPDEDEPAASSSAPSTSDSAPQPPTSSQPYAYISSDGRRKAVIEDAAPSLNTRDTAAPWELGFQLSERTDFLWNDGLKARLVARAAGGAAGLGDDEVADRLRRLVVLLPGLASRIPTLDPKLLARLITDLDGVAARLVGIIAAVPGVNVVSLVSAEPRLALEADPAALGAAVADLRALLPPHADVPALISEFPAYLDVAGVRAALAEAARVAPSFDLAGRIAAGEAASLFRFQARDLLIPYDQFSSDGSHTW